MTKKEMRDKNLISFCNLHLFATDNGGYKSKANRCKTHWSKWFGFDSKHENELQKVFSALSTFLYHRSTMLPCVSDYSTFSFNDMHIAHAHNVITCPFLRHIFLLSSFCLPLFSFIAWFKVSVQWESVKWPRLFPWSFAFAALSCGMFR